MTDHNYEPNERDITIEKTSSLSVYVDKDWHTVTISDVWSKYCNGFIHLHKREAITTARAILKHFGEGVE